jgi:hypothetical protein
MSKQKGRQAHHKALKPFDTPDRPLEIGQLSILAASIAQIQAWA